METPSSTRRVTRSQTLASMNSGGGNIPICSTKADDSVMCESKSRQRGNKERGALIDITNDSPIVGVAMETPSSGMAATKKKRRIKRTPGSGEALLRGQVKTLLQKVEEEAELSKLSTVARPFLHLITSPIGLLAPTPANTPQIPMFPGADEVVPVAGEDLIVVSSQEGLSISRSLMPDFSEKSESSCEDDSSSVWSMLVNASTEDEDEDLEGICEGIRKMKVECGGKHTRFVYDSEGEEIVEEERDEVLRLKGLPSPKGKHLRFADC